MGWSAWQDLGGTITSGPAVASWAKNRLDCFAKGTNGHLYHRWSEGGTTFSVWEDIGVPNVGWQDAPAAVSWGPNRIDCFVRGVDDHTYHIRWDGGPTFKGWDDLGAAPNSSALAVASWTSSRLDLFTKVHVNEFGHFIWHKWSGDGSTWSAWENTIPVSLGFIQDEPAAVSWGPNRIDCFVRGPNDHLHHMWWDGSFKGWDDLGGTITSGPAVSSTRESNRLDCFAIGHQRPSVPQVVGWWCNFQRVGGYRCPQRRHARCAGCGLLGSRPHRLLCTGHGQPYVPDFVELRGLLPRADSMSLSPCTHVITVCDEGAGVGFIDPLRRRQLSQSQVRVSSRRANMLNWHRGTAAVSSMAAEKLYALLDQYRGPSEEVPKDRFS